MTDRDEHVKGGPANHASHTDLDAPTPPGGTHSTRTWPFLTVVPVGTLMVAPDGAVYF